MRDHNPHLYDGHAEGGRWHRMLMAVMGPADIAPGDAPLRVPVQRHETCTQCHASIETHEVVREPDLTWLRCPAA